MPTIKIIDSVKIDVYSREHPPPHFNAKYAEFEELIIIDSLQTYAGKIPKTQRQKVIEWAEFNKHFLQSTFKLLNPRI